MKRGKLVAVAMLVVSWGGVHDTLGATMTFDTLPLGRLFGAAAGDQPGDPPVFEQDGIEMFVEQILVDGVPGFLNAEVGGRYVDFLSTHSLDLNNISVRFDFRNLGFDVNSVSLEFVELGPMNNFSVNNNLPSELASLQFIPTDIAPGVEAVVTDGVITLSGHIDEILIGGQELGIDTIFAIPEPTTWLLLVVGGALLGCRRRRSPVEDQRQAQSRALREY